MERTAPRERPTGVVRLLSVGIGPKGDTIGTRVGWEAEAHDGSEEAQSALDGAADVLAIPPGWRRAAMAAGALGPIAHLKVSFARDFALVPRRAFGPLSRIV